MKLTFNLSEAEIKEALINLVKKHYSIANDKKLNVNLNFHDSGNDPRESSYFSATVSE